MKQQEGETFKTHLPCPHPKDKCGSSDAVTLYRKYDKKGREFLDGFCFSCQKVVSPKLVETFYGEDFDGEGYEEDQEETEEVIDKIEDILKLECRGSRQRQLKVPVNEEYGVRTEFGPDGKSVARYYPVTDQDGNIVGFKKRDLTVPKKHKYHFTVIGKAKNSHAFFGQHLYSKGGKFLIIVGGEEDALAMKQVMSNHSKYDTPVVSPINGESSTDKQIKENFEWVSSFEKVIIMMDNDDAGKEAALKAAKMLKPGQAYIANLKFNDPCEYTKRDPYSKELYEEFWNAVNNGKYTPAGVVGSSQTYSALMERATWIKLPLPSFAKQLNEMMNGGFALGEIINVVAASSIGKTTVVNEFLYHFVFNSEHKIGVIPLESDMGELMENLISIHLNIKLANMPDDEKLEFYQTEKFKEAYDELTKLPNGEDRFIILDHQGDVADDDLKDKIEYMVKGCDCKGIILDPLTLALSGQHNEGMDEFMSWLLRFVKREKVIHINVAHVRKSGSGSKANSTGADIHEEDIKGSGSIFQVGMVNILLMRDKENPNALIRNTIKAVVSKARRTGNTGPAGFWFYNSETSRLEEGFDPSDGDYTADEEDFSQLGAYTQEDLDDQGTDVGY